MYTSSPNSLLFSNYRSLILLVLYLSHTIDNSLGRTNLKLLKASVLFSLTMFHILMIIWFSMRFSDLFFLISILDFILKWHCLDVAIETVTSTSIEYQSSTRQGKL